MASSYIDFQEQLDKLMCMNIKADVSLSEDIKGVIIRDYSKYCFWSRSPNPVGRSRVRLPYGNFVRFCFVFKHKIQLHTLVQIDYFTIIFPVVQASEG
jgi:hypothetical protein